MKLVKGQNKRQGEVNETEIFTLTAHYYAQGHGSYYMTFNKLPVMISVQISIPLTISNGIINDTSCWI